MSTQREVVATALTTVKTRRVEWVYQDRVPLRTGTILAGMGGIAKSTILSDVIARATRGELPGTFAGAPISVGLISPEDDIESVLVPRLIAARADLRRVVNLSTVVVSDTNGKSWSTLPNIQDDLPALGELIREHEIKLLVVDPLVSIMVGNSISQSDVRRNFDPLSGMAADLEFALLAVAHFGKSGERAGDRLSGSHAFRDVARSLIVAAIDEDTENRVLTVEKSNYSPLQPSDAYAIDSVSVRLDDGHDQMVGRAVLLGSSDVTVQDIMDRERDQSSLSGDMQTIIAYVARAPGEVTAKDVARDVKDADGSPIDEGKARKYLNRAAGRGDIERRSRGQFASLSRGSSVSSVPSSGQIGHITHKSSIETCPKCGLESHSTNASAGLPTPGLRGSRMSAEPSGRVGRVIPIRRELTREQARTLLDAYPGIITTGQLTAAQITHTLKTGEALGTAREETVDDLDFVLAEAERKYGDIFDWLER